jgi:anti-sigma regulatory factor (Ser/Thr protein kinase)
MMVRRQFHGSPDSIREARRFASESTADLSDNLRDAVALMVSELATNALVHASVGFDVAVDRSGTSLRVTVSDQGDGIPALRAPGSDEPHGRGLRIVEALSQHWGVTDTSGGGKAVWFEIGLELSSEGPADGEHADVLMRELAGDAPQPPAHPIRPLKVPEYQSSDRPPAPSAQPGGRLRLPLRGRSLPTAQEFPALSGTRNSRHGRAHEHADRATCGAHVIMMVNAN